jgi:Response regulator containing a CheY-like receiver domain and an HTH DNA-binding domain
VLKASAFAELDAAIECVMAGHRFLSPSINDVILDSYVIGKGEFLSQDPLSLLSERERAVLRLICKERPPKAIAAELGISRKTVDIHKKNIMAKLGVSSDLGLYKVCMGLGLIPSPGGASAPR